VPPSASSKRPLLRPVAPVNAPFSCPNSSDSISSSGIAAQFTATNGRVALLLCWWISRATISFPEPFSPAISTEALVGPAAAISARTRCMAADSPINRYFFSTLSFSSTFSRRSSPCSMARERVMSSLVREIGFSMKSKAPILTAFTAVSIVP